ncbi:hypothetical protein TNCV_1633311 [Trichonephila clavipes]|nr:hypothetical protein TNCV_1633311 [Trichonephila clavipes]
MIDVMKNRYTYRLSNSYLYNNPKFRPCTTMPNACSTPSPVFISVPLDKDMPIVMLHTEQGFFCKDEFLFNCETNNDEAVCSFSRLAMRTRGTRATDDMRHNIFGTPPIKMVSNFLQWFATKLTMKYYEQT